ncbi:MAG: hypothetical protein QOH63_1295 [Acidobacteriota bacterium]|jgi:nucleoside-diphosphate-sugar epimerase|nr:hypothetical protein [Acidobacteriota bacterium]
MRALVTGASGFVGSYLVEALLRGGESVAILCRHESDLWRIEEALPRLTLIRGDFTEPSLAEDEIKEFAPDTVFHLAWYGVGGRHRHDDAHIDKNFLGSIALLRLVLRVGCRTFVGLGSQAEYGPQERVLNEEGRTEPTTAYGVAKLCTYLFANYLAASSGMRFVWLRLFSSYGPKDNPEWMIPYLMRTLLRGERPALTAGEQRWDYVYVADAADAIYLAAATERAQGVFNLGSGQAHRLRDVVEQIRDMIDPALPLGFGEIAYAPHQVMNLQADITRLSGVTGWHPKTTLSEGLRRTVEWFRANP